MTPLLPAVGSRVMDGLELRIETPENTAEAEQPDHFLVMPCLTRDGPISSSGTATLTVPRGR